MSPASANIASSISPRAAIPLDLPVLEALPTSGGGPGYLLQEWRHDNRRILLVRSMTTHVQEEPDN